MSGAPFWSAYISAYRKLHGLTQERLAEQLGVTTPTVSRWESGRQIPDFSSQQRLKSAIGIGSIMSAPDWITRVNASHGHEILIAPDMSIVAISDAVRRFWNQPQDAYIGHPVEEFLPGGPKQGAAELAKFGIAGLKEIGLFDGLVRQVFIVVDYQTSKLRQSRAYDIWPVITSSDRCFAHFVGHPVDYESSDERETSFRIRTCEVTLYDARSRGGSFPAT